HHVRRHPGPLDGRAVAGPFARRVAAVRVERVTEGTGARVRQETVLALPARAVRRVVGVDVDVAAERVEWVAPGGRTEAEDGGVVVGEGAEQVIPLMPGPVRLDLQHR